MFSGADLFFAAYLVQRIVTSHTMSGKVRRDAQVNNVKFFADDIECFLIFGRESPGNKATSLPVLPLATQLIRVPTSPPPGVLKRVVSSKDLFFVGTPLSKLPVITPQVRDLVNAFGLMLSTPLRPMASDGLK